jgi:hypothetical protein
MSAPGNLSDDLRSDVRDIVQDAVQWQLPKEQWLAVEDIVIKLHHAWRNGDPKQVEEQLTALELIAPLRITPIGGPPTESAPQRLKKVVEDVVHDLNEGLDDPELDGDHGTNGR